MRSTAYIVTVEESQPLLRCEYWREVGWSLAVFLISFVIGSFKRFFGEGLTVGGSRYQLQMIANPPKDHALTSGANISSAMVVNGASPLMQRSVGQPFKIYYNGLQIAEGRI